MLHCTDIWVHILYIHTMYSRVGILYRYRNTYIVDGLLDRRVPLCQHEFPLELRVAGAGEGDVEVDVAGKRPDVVHGESMESHHGVLKHKQYIPYNTSI